MCAVEFPITQEFSLSDKFIGFGPILPNWADTRHPLNGTQVMKTLKIDAEHRSPGLSGDLISINAFDQTKDKDAEKYSYLKIAPEMSNIWSLLSGSQLKPGFSEYNEWDPGAISTKMTVKTRAQFERELLNRTPFLRGFDWSNVALAGGLVSDILMDSKFWSDVDLFIYGTNIEGAVRKVKTIVNWFLRWCDEQPRYRVYMMVKSENLLQIYVHKMYEYSSFEIEETYEIQIIFRLYQSFSEILHGFDLGSSAVGYNGQNVYFTSLSQYAYANLVNIIDPTRRSTTYERRLHKYMKKGFKVVAPDLKEMLLTDQPIIGPVYSNGYLSQSQLGSVGLNGCKIFSNNETNGLFDYKSSNCRPSKMLAELLGEDFHHNKLVLASRHQLKKAVESEGQKLYRESYVRLNHYSSIKQWIYHYGKETLIDFIESGCRLKSKSMTRTDLKHWQHSRLARVPEYLSFLKENLFQIDWKIQDPGAQLTSSFNPIIANPVDWYGPFHWSHDYEPPSSESKPRCHPFIDEFNTNPSEYSSNSDEFEILPDSPDLVYGNVDQFMNGGKN